MLSSLNSVWRCASILLLLLSALSSAQENATTSPAPSAPSSDNSTTVSPAPTVVTGNDTVAPTAAPSGNATTMSPVPTLAPTSSNVTTESPTMAPNTTIAPTPAPSQPSPAPSQPSPASPAPSKHYFAPTSAPSDEPIPPPPKDHHRASIWRIIGKTIALLILMGLSLLLFGAVMSNRYRIYYYIRSAWYSFLRWEGTRYVIRKLRLERFFGGQETSLNGIIFDNDMTEGLLMQDT